MGPKKSTESALPFGAGAVEAPATGSPRKRRPRKAPPESAEPPKPKDVEAPAPRSEAPREEKSGEGGASQRSRRRGSRRGGGRRGRGRNRGEGDGDPEAKAEGRTGASNAESNTTVEAEGKGEQRPSGRSERRRRWQERRGSRKRKGPGGEGGGTQTAGRDEDRADQDKGTKECEGLLILERANHGQLRSLENEYIPDKNDVQVPPRLVQKFGLREGSIIAGRWRRGQGRYKRELIDVATVDGKDPGTVRKLKDFKQLTSIDPDFHYAVGDSSGDVSLKVVDLICPIGRGQRGLIVAPPRSGKTVLLQSFAKAVEKAYPEVHLIVLLIDERPEEATEWRRCLEHGQVFVSTNDELHKRHVDLAESVWKRCRRLVELGEDVILVLDSITRLGRAYNNVHGNSGKTMSGGIDTRALERPKQFFGAARNTETVGSLTILGTALIETGSRMDQVIFEEFKGTGNMELVLARRLADRRIFPAIDLERSGTRKEEKLLSSRRLKLINTLRRVLTRMHWAEAMELLITKLDDVEKTDEFLTRFEIDPEA